jgi:translation initiation factor IF-3
MVNFQLSSLLNKGKTINKNYTINERIKSPELRVIGPTGENFGVISKIEALKKAEEYELDLVLLVETATPPVAKIIDFNKFLYEERKKESAAKARSKKSEVKQLNLSIGIGEGDIQQRIVRAKEFLADNNKVKFVLKLKGRQLSNPELGFAKINRVIKDLEEVGKPESEAKIINNLLTVTIIKK